MTNFKGKAIYQPAGKAAEYAKWACNFYTGCSNGCTYCYLKKGRGAKILGGDKPTLKKCFKDEHHAFDVFVKEMEANLPELQKHGIFFSFSTDPMLPETVGLTYLAMAQCIRREIPVKILSKYVKYIELNFFEIDGRSPKGIYDFPLEIKKLIAFGFTLTGHDELEPDASTNQERIEAMKKLHDAGFKTFASIEPIIDFKDSLQMIKDTVGSCDLYKIGLMSGKDYNKNQAGAFIDLVIALSVAFGFKVYWKDSILKKSGIERNQLHEHETCVTSDYNIFNQ